MKYTPLSNFIFLTTFFEIINASFNLNTSGPDLANTTSQALVPVDIAAQVFQYTLARYCTKWASKFQTAHDYPGSAYQFKDYWLASMGNWWAGEFADGWKRLQQCAKAVESTTLSSAMSITTSTASISSSGTSTTNSASSTGTGNSISSTAVVSAESSSSTATSVTTKPGALKVGYSLGLAFLGNSYSMFFM
ncbi:hypothetical protein BPAE_0224g00160 [Botrytis paeoniae]|uniref:Uncharacterized protein n=1 Tax=Botrytis paeoniae TaxID=278948 RepID=A0A4Z1FDI1_9HELO|nr:hypothetical protein BPAE_0224g00160 [Botrytis paeoniae]